MTNCNAVDLEFPALKGKKVQAQFSGGAITSDGGVLLLRQMDRQLGLINAVNQAIEDPRDQRYVSHPQSDLLRQRIFGLALAMTISMITINYVLTRRFKRWLMPIGCWVLHPRYAGWRTGPIGPVPWHCMTSW